MNDLKRRFLLDSLRAADLIVMAVAVGIGLIVSGHLSSGGSLDQFLAVRIKLVNIAFVVGIAIAWHLLFRLFGLYRSRRIGLISAEWWDIVKAVSIGTLVLSGFAPILSLSAVNRAFVLTFFLTAVVGTIAVRTCLRVILGEARRNGRNLRNLVIVGCGPRGTAFGKEVRSKPELGYMLLGYIDHIDPPTNPLHGEAENLLGHPSKAREILGDLEVDEVVITLPIKSFYETISNLITICQEMGLVVRLPADFFESRLINAFVDEFQDITGIDAARAGPPWLECSSQTKHRSRWFGSCHRGAESTLCGHRRSDQDRLSRPNLFCSAACRFGSSRVSIDQIQDHADRCRGEARGPGRSE